MEFTRGLRNRVRGEGLRWPFAGFRREPVVLFQGFVEAGPQLGSSFFFGFLIARSSHSYYGHNRNSGQYSIP